MVPVSSCAHWIAAFLECCRTWLLPTNWSGLESPTVCGCREMRQHGFCYILNTPARSLEQAPAAVQKESGLVRGCTSATKAGKRMKSYLVVLSVSMVLFIACAMYLSPYCCYCQVQRLLSSGCGLWHIKSLSFWSDDQLYVWLGKNSWGVWLSLRYCFALIFLALCLVHLSTSPCKGVACHSPPGQLQNDCRMWKCVKKTLFYQCFFFFFPGDRWCWEEK